MPDWTRSLGGSVPRYVDISRLSVPAWELRRGSCASVRAVDKLGALIARNNSNWHLLGETHAEKMGSYVSDWLQPGNFKASCGGAFAKNLKPTAGDFSCLVSLFFDNLATIVAGCGIIQCMHSPSPPEPCGAPRAYARPVDAHAPPHSIAAPGLS